VLTNIETAKFADQALALDITAPTVSSTSPVDNATGVAVGNNIVLTFSENVKAGAGNILIHKTDGTVVATISIADSSQVSFSGSTVTVNPLADLLDSTGYYVTVEAGAITDLAGNYFAGISDPTVFNFITAAPADVTAPTLASTSPADNAAEVPVSSNIVLTFSESVKAGSGNIVLYTADGAVAATIAITDATQVTISGNTVTINPAADFLGGFNYYVTVDAGAVTDLAGNAFAGISGATAFNFAAAYNTVTGTPGDDTLIGTAGGDYMLGLAGNDTLSGGDEHDTLVGGLGDDTLDGGSNVDIAVFSGNYADYAITQLSTGVWRVVGADGTDTLSNIEYAKFDDKTVRLIPGTGVSIDIAADPNTFMASIRDFDGNDLGGAGGWSYIGIADTNGDGLEEYLFANRLTSRWAEVTKQSDGLVYFSDYTWAGDTRIVGIYIDPLVTLGIVQQGSDYDSQRRFQNDLSIGNIKAVLGQNDYNHDGLQEVYFSLTDGTAYLHAYMHADGNIQYTNYQTAQQAMDYLTANGWSAATWSGWFPSNAAPLSGSTAGSLLASAG
jgi:methionine-rich copper-binding protein CopC